MLGEKAKYAYERVVERERRREEVRNAIKKMK